MHHLGRGPETDVNKLERWLGADHVDNLSKNMEKFYWPIALHGVPGKVYAMPGGGFSGKITAGEFMSAMDRAEATAKRLENAQKAKIARHRIFQNALLRSKLDKSLNAFTNLSAIIAAGSGGKLQQYPFAKTGTAPTAIGGAIDLWTIAGMPVAGAAGSAAPGGKAWSNTDTGALAGYQNAATANANHFIATKVTASVAPNSLLIYDRTFSVAKTMNSTAVEAVSGVPTRYNSQTANSPNYCGGTFCFPSIPTTLLPATAHNWTVCTYSNQANGNIAFPSIAGISSCALHQVDLVLGQWFMPLAAGDVGILNLKQMQCSALVATGTVDFVLGQPICIVPCPVAYLYSVIDGINTAFNLNDVLDGACISFLELPKPATGATAYSGLLSVLSE